jgi:hypothetical protein
MSFYDIEQQEDLYKYFVEESIRFINSDFKKNYALTGTDSNYREYLVIKNKYRELMNFDDIDDDIKIFFTSLIEKKFKEIKFHYSYNYIRISIQYIGIYGIVYILGLITSILFSIYYKQM